MWGRKDKRRLDQLARDVHELEMRTGLVVQTLGGNREFVYARHTIRDLFIAVYCPENGLLKRLSDLEAKGKP
jgi:hypothetical protein